MLLPLSRTPALGQHSQAEIDSFGAVRADFVALVLKRGNKPPAVWLDWFAAGVAADGCGCFHAGTLRALMVCLTSLASANTMRANADSVSCRFSAADLIRRRSCRLIFMASMDGFGDDFIFVNYCTA
jgi:hypothetical protein